MVLELYFTLYIVGKKTLAFIKKTGVLYAERRIYE